MLISEDVRKREELRIARERGSAEAPMLEDRTVPMRVRVDDADEADASVKLGVATSGGELDSCFWLGTWWMLMMDGRLAWESDPRRSAGRERPGASGECAGV